MNLPNLLRLAEDGTLYCVNGRDVKEYLRDCGLPKDDPLVLVTRTDFAVALRIASHGWAA